MKKSLRKSHPGKSYGLHSTYVISILIILIGLALDQITKYITVLYQPHKFIVIDNLLWFSYVKNFGAGFGILQGQAIALGVVNVVIAILLLTVLFYKRKPVGESICYSIIISGALGNAIDRFMFGFVTDFIDVGWWPVFNIADSLLVVGILGLLILEVYNHKNNRRIKK